MKKIIVLICLSLTFLSNSQESYKIDYFYKDNSQNTKCSLYIANNEAVFKFYDDRQMGTQDLPDGDVVSVTNDELSKFYYTNDKLSYCRHIFNIYEVLYYDDYNEKVNWNINPEKTKKIGKYNCTEAKTRLNGRNYTVWFTFDVPVKYGPMKFHNLPGLVIEVSEDNGYFTLTFDKISKTKKPKEFDFFKNYFFDKKREVYDYNEYEEKVTKVMVARKISSIAFVKKTSLEHNTEITVDEERQAKEDKNMFVDVPKKLLSELNKYHY